MGTVVITSIIAFTLVIVALVLVLLFAQSKLVQSGDVNIVINGDKDEPLVASAGTNLLSTFAGAPSLAEEMSYLPKWAI